MLLRNGLCRFYVAYFAANSCTVHRCSYPIRRYLSEYSGIGRTAISLNSDIMTETNIQIIHYTPEYRHAFKALNEAWIRQYFKMEEADYKSLDHPESYIIDKGGAILVATLEGEAVGVCALIKMDDPNYDYELAKMAVSPKVQGKGIGKRLAKAVLAHAKTLGAKKVYLESNTILAPAINLYRKLGFQEIQGYESPYERSNIQMGYVVE